MKDTKIEWCDHSWSPWRGCTKVSPGCANCYAETLSKRNPAVLGQWGKGKPRVKAKNWNEPWKWDQNTGILWDEERAAGLPVRRPTVFPSLCDWLDDEVPIEWLAEFLQLIHATPNLTWLLLTKRPENFEERVAHALEVGDYHKDRMAPWLDRWLCGDSPANVWLGTSVEDQTRADERIPALLKIPARGRFLSLEPLLGPVQIKDEWLGYPCHGCQTCGFTRGHRLTELPGLDWLIIGGESGPGARPCNVEWVRSLVRQGKEAGVPTFVKQLGAEPTFNAPRKIDDWGQEHISEGAWISAMTHPKGGDPAEWPEDLRVREFPQW